MPERTTTIPARDGYRLAATVFEPDGGPNGRVVSINAATATPRGFYTAFARYLAERGYTAVSYDYRGIGGSRPRSLRGFRATARDWALLDMAGVVDWIAAQLAPRALAHVGHSIGGQTAGLLPNADRIDALVALSAQSGYWRLQGGNQRLPVAFHMYVTFPVLSTLCGYLPWSRIGKAEDLPKGVALEWSRWCRDPDYLLGDETLPLERFARFRAPVLAYSFADDDWGTARSVDAMMRVYPQLERRHRTPDEVGLARIGHFGFFKAGSRELWEEVVEWIEARLASDGRTPPGSR
jgi:predicted alpha/beta hydrolase